MSGFDRRRFLKGAAATSAGAALPFAAGAEIADARAGESLVPRGATTQGAAPRQGGIFPQGVVSGDPSPDRALIWTRVLPPTDASDIEVTWQVSVSPTFETLVASGTTAATAAADHCVKVAVAGLSPDRWYFYRFLARGATSQVGRARTAPAEGTTPDRLRFAVTSCQLWNNGFYTAYRSICEEDCDLLLFLGDYIYEYGGVRPTYGRGLRFDPVDHPGTLDGFRSKYRLYRSDPDLQACHANMPMAPMWDDHEISDNYRHDLVAPELLEAGYRAWFDFQPVVAPEEERFRTYRSFRWGDLAEFFLTDARQYRDPEAGVFFDTTYYPGSRATLADRTMLGLPQRDWLVDGLTTSTAAWKLFGNPVMMMPLRFVDLDTPATRRLFPQWPRNAGIYLNGDQWDGYQAERRRILEAIESSGADNVTIFTGDIHTFWCGSLRPDVDDDRSPKVAAEFVCGSVTSPGFEATFPNAGVLASLSSRLTVVNPHLQFVNLFEHGYGVVEVNPEETVVEFKAVDLSAFERPVVRTIARMRVLAGTNDIEMLPVG
ncbi:MAG: alkaline phosphatase D family protein [Acidimicrobiia bacterium]